MMLGSWQTRPPLRTTNPRRRRARSYPLLPHSPKQAPLPCNKHSLPVCLCQRRRLPRRRRCTTTAPSDTPPDISLSSAHLLRIQHRKVPRFPTKARQYHRGPLERNVTVISVRTAYLVKRRPNTCASHNTYINTAKMTGEAWYDTCDTTQVTYLLLTLAQVVPPLCSAQCRQPLPASVLHHHVLGLGMRLHQPDRPLQPPQHVHRP